MVEKLYTVYCSELFRYCCRICGNVSDAEDLLQETFMRALANLDLLEELEERKQRAWLYRVARNLFFDKCRRKRLERNLLPENVVSTFADDFSGAETAELLSKLPAEMASVFFRRYFLGYSSAELAEEYGLSPSGIRAMLSRARKLLREQIKDEKEDSTL